MIHDSALVSAGMPVLWMDDKWATVERIAALLSKEESRIAVEPARTIAEARQKLESRRYRGLIIDCKMDDADDRANGAEFLLEVNRTEKTFPTFVFSAFLDDPLYSDLIRRSYAVLSVNRLSQLSSPLSKHPFFSRVTDEVILYNEVKDKFPEQIRFEDYVRSPHVFQREIEIHWSKHRNWISHEMKRRSFAWCVVCGESIVSGSSDIFEFPEDEELDQIGRQNHLIPFAYSQANLPEEVEQLSLPMKANWHATDQPDDWYPSIRVKIDDLEVVEDFDTGAVITFLSDKLVRRSRFSFLREVESHHLGKSYKFYPKKVSLTLIDSLGRSLTKRMTVHVVDSWSKSPFSEVRKGRRALVGRDILRAFDVEVVLNSGSKITEVRFLDKGSEADHEPIESAEAEGASEIIRLTDIGEPSERIPPQ